MKANLLIGKNAIRTKRANIAGGGVDRSYMTSPIHIIKVTETHIVYKHTEHFTGILESMNDLIYVLSYEYCDENWVDYDELIKAEVTA